MEARSVRENRHFGDAVCGQVGDEAVVADVAVETEHAVAFQCFDDVGAVFDAARRKFDRLFLEIVRVRVFCFENARPFEAGGGFAAEIRLVAIPVHAMLVLAEIGEVFGEMAGRFGHEIAELAEDFAADLFVGVVFRLLNAFAQNRIEVFSMMLELDEPRHVVDARACVVDFFFGNARVARQQVKRRLDAVAEADDFYAAVRDGPAHGRHGIDVVEHQRVGAEFAHVLRHIPHDGQRAQRAEDAARRERVADALVHAVFERDVDVGFVCAETADFERADDVVRVFQGFAAVRRDGYRDG